MGDSLRSPFGEPLDELYFPIRRRIASSILLERDVSGDGVVPESRCGKALERKQRGRQAAALVRDGFAGFDFTLHQRADGPSHIVCDLGNRLRRASHTAHMFESDTPPKSSWS